MIQPPSPPPTTAAVAKFFGASSSSSSNSHSAFYGDSSVSLEAKEEVMDEVYCKVADRYDTVSDMISLFLNKVWKQSFVNYMMPLPGEQVLDMCGGTCEITKRYFKYQDKVNNDTKSTVHVVDFSENMLKVGQRRLSDTQWMRDNRISFAKGNAEDLSEIADNTYDLYIISAGMHNLGNREKALAEAYRVVKPGGRFACLEYGQVEKAGFDACARWYWDNAVPALGGLLANDRASYERLARSVRAFPHQAEFAKSIRAAGFELPGKKGYELIYWGLMVAFVGTKPKI